MSKYLTSSAIQEGLRDLEVRVYIPQCHEDVANGFGCYFAQKKEPQWWQCLFPMVYPHVDDYADLQRLLNLLRKKLHLPEGAIKHGGYFCQYYGRPPRLSLLSNYKVRQWGVSVYMWEFPMISEAMLCKVEGGYTLLVVWKRRFGWYTFSAYRLNIAFA